MKERLLSPIWVRRLGSRLGVNRPHTSKLLRVLCGHSPQMSQIALISDQHDDNVRVGVVPQLFQPPVHILVGLVLADIINQEGTDGTTVVGRGNGAVPFLTGGIPNLSLDGLGVDLDRTGRKLDTDSGLGV